MSSRNTYLTPAERKEANILFKALSAAKSAYEAHTTDSKELVSIAEKIILSNPNVKLDYITVSGMNTGEEVPQVTEEGAMISGAIWINKTRLIDNMLLYPPQK